MDRAFSSGASGSAPSVPASPSIGYPTKGNAGTGTPATKPGEWWYHMITEEIRGIIVAAGLTPTHTDITQLLQAIQALSPQFTDQTGLLSPNGWVSIPLKISGVKRKIYFQWGQNTFPSGGTVTQANTFPIAFPNACFTVNVGNWENVNNNEGPVQMRSPTTTGFTAYCFSAITGATGYSYFAIGW